MAVVSMSSNWVSVAWNSKDMSFSERRLIWLAASAVAAVSVTNDDTSRVSTELMLRGKGKGRGEKG